jgi:hypothetical protein
MKNHLMLRLLVAACTVVICIYSAVEAQAPQDASPPGTYQQGDYYSYNYSSSLTSEQRQGRDTWYWWTGGGEQLWRQIAIVTKGDMDLLMYTDSRRRNSRFRILGVMNDPDCYPASAADQYGMWMDVCKSSPIPGIPGTPSGIVGLRKFDNPKFDPQRWDLQKYLKDRGSVEPPYIIGMTCGFCHVGPNPLNPPADPEHPKWGNLASAIGNQYFKEGAFFTLNMDASDFRWHVGTHQPPGTSDTSRVATDHIYNPNAINAIFSLNARPMAVEKMPDGTEQPVYHILKDGADSRGIAMASLRVYVNIGLCSELWLPLHDAVNGLRGQKPFDIEKARRECKKWPETEVRLKNVEAFLRTIGPMRLQDAPGGPRYLTADQELLTRGKIAFAENCASCHSSKQPPLEIASNPARATEWFRQEVLKPDFLENNFLSEDKRHSVKEIGTNFTRAAGSNATSGHIWEQFSSETYKQQPDVGVIKNLYNPVDPRHPIAADPGDGGRGYYRTPTLISIWATAPFLHNNALGMLVPDPSVEGRMLAFNDAVQKLLWPETRLGAQSISVTSTDSSLPLDNKGSLKVPAGTPIALLASLDPPRIQFLRTNNILTRFISWLTGRGDLKHAMLDKNLAPDFVEDRGHTFGAQLSDEQKLALIEYMKTF